MKDILLVQARKLLKAVVVCTVLIALSLFQANRLELMGAVAVGYLLGFAWYAIVLSRMMRSQGMTVPQAKRQMLVGLLIRFLLLIAVLVVAIHISVDVFFAVFASFATVYVIGLLLLVVASYRIGR